MAPTLKDVARVAGVSRSAVSRAFTQGAPVSEATRAKVMEAARALGYRPNALASSLTTGRTKLIGLVSNNFRNPFFLEIFDLFTRTLQDAGLKPLLVNLHDSDGPEASRDMLRQYSVDGVIVASSTLPAGFSRAFRDAGLPVVHAFGRTGGDGGVHLVGVDNVEAGRIAARALLARGYDRVGLLGGPRAASTTQDRRAGFAEVLRDAPGVTLAESFAEDYTFAAGRAEMARLIADGPAQAYFCGDDVISIGALSAVQEAGLRVPGDIGLIGINDMAMAAWQNIALTTIRQPVADLVRAAVEMLLELIETPERPPQARLFTCELVERATLPPVQAPGRD